MYLWHRSRRLASARCVSNGVHIMGVAKGEYIMFNHECSIDLSFEIKRLNPEFSLSNQTWILR